MEKQPTYSPEQYPLSSVIDWSKEEDKLARQREKQQLAQQRIAKTQMLGDTFKLLAETAGAFKGADVEKRQTNPYFLQSVQNQRQADADYDKGIGNLEQNKFSTLLKDRERQVGLVDQAEKEKRDLETYKQKQDVEGTRRAKEAGEAHEREKELIEKRSEATIQQPREKLALDKQEQQAKEEQAKQAGMLKVSSYDDPINTKVDIDRNEALNLLSDFRSWFEENYPYQALPASANIEKNGIVRDDDLIKTIRNYPEFFGQYYPQLYAKGLPEPNNPGQKRFDVYDRNVQAAMERYNVDPSWGEARTTRVQKRLQDEIARLNNEYSDVLEYRDWQDKQGAWEQATGNAKPSSIAVAPIAPQEGVTDVSSFWN